jgi:uncharacterized protein YegP (UPF0339 family)
MSIKRAHWEHYKNPRTGLWDAHSYKNGHVLFASRQGYRREQICLNAIESASGLRESTRVEFRDRVRSRRSK